MEVISTIVGKDSLLNLTVQWPSGKSTQLNAVTPNQLITLLVEDAVEENQPNEVKQSQQLFTSIQTPTLHTKKTTLSIFTEND